MITNNNFKRRIIMNTSEKIAKYRYDAAYGKLYEYSAEHSAYLFVASFQGNYALTEEEAIKQHADDIDDDDESVYPRR